MLDRDTSARLEAFFALERRDALFDFLVDGWSTWRVLRNPLHCIVEDLPLKQIVRSRVQRIAAALLGTIRLLFFILRGSRCELIVKGCRSDLRMQLADGFRDVFFDGLLSTGRSYFKLEEVNSSDFDRQACLALFPPQLDSVVFTFWGRVLGFVFPVSYARQFCNSLSDRLLAEIGIDVSPKWLELRISTAYWQSRLYSILLSRLNPKVVLVSDTGEYGLIIACKRLGIKLIEIQHGVFDSRHPDAIPVWTSGTSTQLLLPDILACRSDYWIEKLAGTRQGRDHAIAVGNEFIDLARDRLAALDVEDDVFRIVVSSQGLDSERLSAWLEELISSEPDDVDWEVAVKLHPVYDAGTSCFDGLAKNPRVQIVSGGASPNIYDLLERANLHLSIASACHFDAAALGIPSGIIPLSGYESMLEVVDDYHFFVVREPQEAWFVRRSMPPSAGFCFSTPGYCKNLLDLIDR